MTTCLAFASALDSRLSKADILQELPQLKPEERREVLDRICELEDADLLSGMGPTVEEKRLLDRELEDYRQNLGAGSTWQEVETQRLTFRKRGDGMRASGRAWARHFLTRFTT